ncbi:MAG: hypothetical protein HRT90_03420 [Candidatus Margulisbacteria bacterium]|nr:hypothetical protein [Candidatus Margulisiibacteriota bacterium]
MTTTSAIINATKDAEILPKEPIVIQQSLEHAIDLADKQVILLEKVLEIALRRTNERDWVDQQGHPYLTGSGSEKLMPLFGVSLKDANYEKTISSDDKGQYYIYLYKGQFSWRGGSIIAIGTCSSRDKFFAWNSVDKTYKPDSQIDETNIMKASYTNMMVNGITRLLGIRNLTWDMLRQSGIDKNRVSKVEYRNSKMESPDEENMRKEIYEKLMEIHGMDKVKAVEKLKELTSFQGKDGLVPGVDSIKYLKGKRLEIAYSKVKKEYDIFQKEMRVDQ